MSKTGQHDQFLSLHEASALGYGGYSTLRKHIADGRLPAVRVGRRVKVRRKGLDALAVPTAVSPNALDDTVLRVVRAAPHLTDEQRSKLRVVLGGGAL